MAKAKPKTIPLPKKKIDEIFDNPEITHQSEAWSALWKIAIPDMSNPEILSIIGYPTVNRETNEYLFKKFIEFDRTHHTKAVNGGLWLSLGFSSLNSENLESWEISMENCHVEYAQPQSIAM